MEFYCEGKYMGSKPCKKPIERSLGYNGRKYFTAKNEFYITKNNKAVKINKDVNYYTEIIQLCGRMKS